MSAPALGYHHVFSPASVAGRPTLLLLHGTGGDERQLLGLGGELAPGSAVLSPRGDVLERGAPRFFRRFAEGVFDTDDVTLRAGALAAFVRDAAAHYAFDARNVIAVGFSNGANIAGAMMLLEPSVLRGGVLLRAQMVAADESLAAGAHTLAGTAALLSAGSTDPIVPPDETERLARALRERGADVTLRWEHAGHAITRGDVDTAIEWVAALPARA